MDVTPAIAKDSSDSTQSEQRELRQREFTWADPATWPASLKFLPIFVILLGIFIAVYWNHFMNEPDFDTSTLETCRSTYNHTFRINAVRHQAEALATRSVEYGTAAEAVHELVNPDTGVFGTNPFPNDRIPPQGLRMDQALIWVYQRIRYDIADRTLYDDTWSVSGPAALGIPAVMVGQRWKQYLDAAERQKEYLLRESPKYKNGAISHRTEVPELWSEAIGTFPPFLAYYAVHLNDTELLKEAVRQCQLYREILQITSGPKQGLWQHAVGPSDLADSGAWSTGNAWAVYGMARTRATISGWKASRELLKEQINDLDAWIGEILNGAIHMDNDFDTGLLRNYLGDDSWFGETSGTALMAAAVYRMAVLKPEIFAREQYLDWAGRKRRAVAERVDDQGFVYPAVDPLRHQSREAIKNSPEGLSYVIMMTAAWRDCVCSGVCKASV